MIERLFNETLREYLDDIAARSTASQDPNALLDWGDALTTKTRRHKVKTRTEKAFLVP